MQIHRGEGARCWHAVGFAERREFGDVLHLAVGDCALVRRNIRAELVRRLAKKDAVAQLVEERALEDLARQALEPVLRQRLGDGVVPGPPRVRGARL